jgi:PAS domain S-box-containing protein
MNNWYELFEQINWAVLVQQGPELRFVYANEAARRLLGRNEVLGKSIPELFPEADLILLRRVRQTLAAGRPFVGMEEPVTIDWNGNGEIETRFLTFFSQSVIGPDSEIEYVISFASDVSERVLARNRSGTQWSDSALHAVRTPILIVDPTNRTILFGNRAANLMFGTVSSVGSTVGRAFGIEAGYRLTDASDCPIKPDDNAVTQAARGEQVGPVELHWYTPTSRIVLVCFAELLGGRDSEHRAVVISLFDVTQLRRLRDELSRAERARDDFVHLVAHELRTPMTGLRLQVEAARRKHSDLPGILAVGRAVDRMSKRVEQLLDVADMHEHLVVLHTEYIDLRDVVREAIQLLQPQASWSRCDVRVSYGPPCLGLWDGPRLVQVVTSIVANAVKFGVGKPVQVLLHDEGGSGAVSVIDHGIGVAPEDRETIFERFERRASLTNYGGLGLDLWVTRELLRQMGGSVEVGDTPGGGATFTVHVPKHPEIDQRPSTDSACPSPS